MDLGINLKVNKAAKNLILEKGYNIDYGVRFLRRTIQFMIEDPILKLLLKNNILKGETLIVKSVKDKIIISLNQVLILKSSLFLKSAKICVIK